MAKTAYETWSRGKSAAMFATSVIFTVLIVTVLALVTGYLVSKGYQSIDLNFFTQDPADADLKPSINYSLSDVLQDVSIQKAQLITPAMADAIVAHRPYSSISDLTRAGVAPSVIELISDSITLNKPEPGKPSINVSSAAEIRGVTVANAHIVTPALAKEIIAHRPYASIGDLSKSGLPPVVVDLLVGADTAKFSLNQPEGNKPSINLSSVVEIQKAVETALTADTSSVASALQPRIDAITTAIVAHRPFASMDDLSQAGLPARIIDKIADASPAPLQLNASATDKTPSVNQSSAAEIGAALKTFILDKDKAFVAEAIAPRAAKIATAIVANRPYASLKELSKAGLAPAEVNQFAGEARVRLEHAKGGMRAGIVGTLILVSLASLLGIPLGTLAGIYLAEYSSGSFLASPVRFVADVLSGVPSIVVGILGYTLLARTHFNGYAGILALAFIMIPLVTRTTEEMLLLVPRSYREASVALGATKVRTILRVVLPAAAGSLITGIMLSVARVAGETAPLLLTAVNLNTLTFDLNSWFPSLTVQIYGAAGDPHAAANGRARAGILVLLILIFALNLMVRFTAKAMARSKPRK